MRRFRKPTPLLVKRLPRERCCMKCREMFTSTGDRTCGKCQEENLRHSKRTRSGPQSRGKGRSAGRDE